MSTRHHRLTKSHLQVRHNPIKGSMLNRAAQRPVSQIVLPVCRMMLPVSHRVLAASGPYNAASEPPRPPTMAPGNLTLGPGANESVGVLAADPVFRAGARAALEAVPLYWQAGDNVLSYAFLVGMKLIRNLSWVLLLKAACTETTPSCSICQICCRCWMIPMTLKCSKFSSENCGSLCLH